MATSRLLDVASWAWDNRDAINKGLKSLFGWFSSPESRILILGPGGAGKTTLSLILGGQFDRLIHPAENYRESVETEKVSSRGQGRLEIPPGQPYHFEHNKPEVYAGIQKGKYRGILFVTCFGMTSVSIPRLREHRLFTGDRRKFVEDHSAEGRAEELKRMQELLPHIEKCRKRLWLCNVVTKQDLWWQKRKAVREFYSVGKFGACVADLKRKQPGRPFDSETVYCSLLIRRLETQAGDLVAPNVGGYDEATQTQSLRQLLETVDRLRRWGEQK